jgi:hypothetical protein
MGNKTRRHYRVAQKEILYKPIASKGIFIKNKHKPKIIAGLICIAGLLFLKGFLLGLLAKKDC